MCWNPDISINTFVFGCLSLLFIYFANTYTRYKMDLFKTPFMYLFMFQVASIQLIEFFLWRNMNNKSINRKLSFLTFINILLQHISLIFIIPQLNIRHIVLSIYICLSIFYYVFRYTYSPMHFYTSVKNGHLSWEWPLCNGYEDINFIVGLPILAPLYILPFALSHKYFVTVSTLLSIILTFILFYRQKTFPSMWCWMSNFIFLVCIIYTLIVGPFIEYNGLC